MSKINIFIAFNRVFHAASYRKIKPAFSKSAGFIVTLETLGATIKPATNGFFHLHSSPVVMPHHKRD